MERNRAGGYVFKADDWTRLERFLVLGTEGGTYYASERELTLENSRIVERCLVEDGPRTVKTIVDISVAGRPLKQDATIFALALACSVKHGDSRDTVDPNDPLRLTRELALREAPKVLRTGSHMLRFLQYCRYTRGWGSGLRGLVNRWYNEADSAERTVFQCVKYQQRNGWSHRDALRLGHPRPRNDEFNSALKFIVGKDESDGKNVPGIARDALSLKLLVDSPERAAKIISESKLPREVVPTELLNSVEVWEALLESMPITAMIRNLGKMSAVGLLTSSSEATRHVFKSLGDEDLLKRGRVHPLSVFMALRTYQSGHGVRGKLSWKTVSKIVDALDEAFYSTMRYVEPLGKRVLYAADNSGSMTGGSCSGSDMLTPAEASVALAMVYQSVESELTLAKFATRCSTLNISKRQRVDDAVRKLGGVGEGTDCAMPLKWASSENVDVDVVIEFTDGQSWHGDIHVSQELEKYRNRVGHDVKLAVIYATPSEGKLTSDYDKSSLTVSGFDSTVPEAIREFSSN
jgi:60 kDa SS-A/Ro ribonucleoprotein